MNLEEKYKSGKYIFMYKTSGMGWQEYTNARLSLGIRYKLIHKKHKHILDAYLEDNSVDIEIPTGGWHTIGCDWIEGYNENNEYRLNEKEPHDTTYKEGYKAGDMFKPKNNFEEYGLSGDFEGEIYKKCEGALVGCVVQNNKKYSEIWSDDGISLYLKHSGFNLTPIKKPKWYEDERARQLIYNCYPYLDEICAIVEDNKMHSKIEDVRDYFKGICV